MEIKTAKQMQIDAAKAAEKRKKEPKKGPQFPSQKQETDAEKKAPQFPSQNKVVEPRNEK